MPDGSIQKMPVLFECKTCDFNCSKKSNWNKHLATVKHQTIQNHTKIIQENAKSYDCLCGKSYGYASNFYAHRKKCLFLNKKQEGENVLITLVSQVVKSNNELQKQNQDIQKQNHDLQQQILDVCKNNVINNNTINANNSNNKTFNLQVFLNEECKDAMNISDFMSSIQVQLEELECVGRLGFVEGISKIIIKNLKALDIRKRPVHCTDLKRETVYIKENGVWAKDDDSNTKLRKVIKNVSFRNSKNTRLYRDKYPDCVRSESRLSDIYSIIIIEAMGGGSKTDPKEEEDKILRRILKELVFDKSRFLS